jgi:acetylornithine deacetylase
MQHVTDLLCELISIPSVNPMGRSVEGEVYFEGRMTEWLLKFFASFSADCEAVEVVPGRANVLARYGDDPNKPTLLWDAHQDTVPVEGMTVEPFRAKIEQGRVYGRGACDVKGAMAAMLWAFRRLCIEKKSLPYNLVMSCTCDEESTALGVVDLATYWQMGIRKSRLLPEKPIGAIVAEPTDLDVVVAHRGVTRFRIHTRGRACHSSDPKQGINAIYRMARVLQVLEEYADELAKSVIPHPLCGGATLSVGRIEGGISVNVVPDHCAIEIDRRLIPGEDPQVAADSIRSYLNQRLDFEVEFEKPWIECCALTDADNDWLASKLLETMRSWDDERAKQSSSKLCGGRRRIGVPYGTNASTLCEGGVPSVVFGPGSIAQAHTKDEFIEISELEKGAEIYYRSVLA